ncbi:GntR family transcriptional regulator [Desulfosarcina sp.]|uniref:GntR family transcriptional regulator n=1 Tax=Desulfosarcina sp. TaxID=2027861 RepID=UPI003970B4D3
MKNIGVAHENLDHQVYLIVKQMITERKLVPGEKIHQEKLASEMGISRTPLINALKFLEKEKLVEAKPRRGFFVRAFTREEAISIFELREVLEGLAARRAAAALTKNRQKKLRGFFSRFPEKGPVTDSRAYAEADRRFHLYISEIGSREFLKSILESFNIISFSYQLVFAEGLVRRPDETLPEHRAIIEAICSGDGDAAEENMRRHFRRSIQRLTAESP